MKERFDIEVAGMQFTIMSDDGSDFVGQVVEAVDGRVQSLLRSSLNCSKLDAIMLTALDFCGEKYKADKRIRSLEAQVELLEGNNRRLREELDGEAESNTVTSASKENKPVPDGAASESEVAADSPAEDDRAGKFREIEAILGGQLGIDFDAK